MWKKRILPLLCALALLAGLLPGRVQAAQTKPVRYLTVTGTPAQLETGRRLPQATPELASDAGAALHLTQVRWYNSITALQQVVHRPIIQRDIADGKPRLLGALADGQVKKFL